MSYETVAVEKKPMHTLSMADWQCRLDQLRNITKARRLDAINIRQAARTLRNQTNTEADWEKQDTEDHLQYRISELQRWREIIAGMYESISKEMELLRKESIITEQELDLMQKPIAVIANCISKRDGHLGSELIYDETYTELRNELTVLENNQRLLAQQYHRAWEKLCRLEDVKFRLGLEIDNKTEAEMLDRAQLALKTNSNEISFKPDSLRNPRNSINYQQWLEHVKGMKVLAENELADTYSIREALFVCRSKARTMMLSQRERANHALRRSIFETSRARNDLQHLKEKLRKEMEATLCEMKKLEDAMRVQSVNLKLAETRMQNRSQRSGLELARDKAQMALRQEVKKLTFMRKQLMNKLREAQTNVNLMDEHMQKLDVDLANKQHALDTDEELLKQRESMSIASLDPTAQTDRNYELLQMERAKDSSC